MTSSNHMYGHCHPAFVDVPVSSGRGLNDPSSRVLLSGPLSHDRTVLPPDL